MFSNGTGKLGRVALATALVVSFGWSTVLAEDVPAVPRCADSGLFGPNVCAPVDDARDQAEATAAATVGEVAAMQTIAEDGAREALLAPPYRVWTSINDGAGSGLDADALDGFSSGYFLDAIAAEADARRAADAALSARATSLEGFVNGGAFRGSSATLTGAATVGGRLDAGGDVVAKGSFVTSGPGGHFISHLPWEQTGFAHGYLKLVTPIADTEGNMFVLRATGYIYHSGAQVRIQCGAYAYGGNTPGQGLLSTGCLVDGTQLPVSLVSEHRGGRHVVVLRIGTPASGWLFTHVTAEYVGWQPKNPADFHWVAGETTSTAGPNLNLVHVDDVAGVVSAPRIEAGSDSAVGDVAEPVVGLGLTPGDVVVSDGFTAAGKLQVKRSEKAYTAGVVGVVSTKPSLTLAGLPTDTPLAVTGIVPVKVFGPVAVNALLTSSDVPGHAMACKDAALCQGAILGKALEAFAGPGQGTVRMMISLG